MISSRMIKKIASYKDPVVITYQKGVFPKGKDNEYTPLLERGFGEIIDCDDKCLMARLVLFENGKFKTTKNQEFVVVLDEIKMIQRIPGKKVEDDYLKLSQDKATSALMKAELNEREIKQGD